jgi:hypothetical protein
LRKPKFLPLISPGRRRIRSDIYDIARFESGLSFSRTFFGSTLLGYAGWLWTLVFALAGAAV